jgi:septum formation protein
MYFARPLAGFDVDEQRVPVEGDGRGALQGRAHRQSPGEADLALRERRPPQEVTYGSRCDIVDSLHAPPASYHSPVRLILASQSPRRAELLAAAGFTFEIDVPEIDEDQLDQETPVDYVRRLAAAKSATVALRHPGSDCVVIGADTTVVINREVLGKPAGAADAVQMLRRLSGRPHEVLTGVSLRRGAREVSRVETTKVWFASMTSEDISWYVASGEGRDKAGAYAIQGLASRFVRHIHGSYTNVVGLPIAVVHELLRELASAG